MEPGEPAGSARERDVALPRGLVEQDVPVSRTAVLEREDDVGVQDAAAWSREIHDSHVGVDSVDVRRLDRAERADGSVVLRALLRDVESATPFGRLIG